MWIVAINMIVGAGVKARLCCQLARITQISKKKKKKKNHEKKNKKKH